MTDDAVTDASPAVDTVRRVEAILFIAEEPLSLVSLAATLGAPQTIVRSSPSPASTRQTRSRSAFGCESAARTRPIRVSSRASSTA